LLFLIRRYNHQETERKRAKKGRSRGELGAKGEVGE
jgi:hypothetical protein